MQGSRLTLEDLPKHLREGPEASSAGLYRFELPAAGVSLGALESHLIRQALERTRGSLRPAAKLLGISYKTLQYRIRKYGFDRDEFGGNASEWAG